jgi:Type IV secretion system proteins
MFKYALLAGICLAALSGTAHAQISVTDVPSLLQQVKGYALEIKGYATQAQQYATQIAQYQQEVQQYLAFVHDPTLGAALGLMNQAGLGNSLPINPMALQSLVSGNANPASIIGALGSLANTSYGANHIYSPSDGSWNSQQLIANGNSVAGVQGAALAAQQNLRDHMPVIQSLRDTLLNAKDIKAVADAQGQLEAETLWTHNLNSQLAAIDVAYRTQQDSRRQRDEESLDQGIDAFLAQANAAGMGINQ